MSNEANRIKLPNKNSKTTYVKSQKTVILSSNLLVYQPASKYGYSGIKKIQHNPVGLIAGPLGSHLTSIGTFNVFNVVLTGGCAAVSDLTMKLYGGKSCLTLRSPPPHLISPPFFKRKYTNR